MRSTYDSVLGRLLAAVGVDSGVGVVGCGVPGGVGRWSRLVCVVLVAAWFIGVSGAARAQTIADVYNELVIHRGYLQTISTDLHDIELQLQPSGTLGGRMDEIWNGIGYNGNGTNMVSSTLALDMATLIANGVTVDWAGLFAALGYNGDPDKLKVDIDDIEDYLNVANGHLSYIRGALDPSSLSSMASSLNGIEGNTDQVEGYLVADAALQGAMFEWWQDVMGYVPLSGSLEADMNSLVEAAQLVVADHGDPGLPPDFVGGPPSIKAAVAPDYFQTKANYAAAQDERLTTFSDLTAMINGRALGASAPVWSMVVPAFSLGVGGSVMPEVAFTVDFADYSQIRDIVRPLIIAFAGIHGLLMVWRELRKQ